MWLVLKLNHYWKMQVVFGFSKSLFFRDGFRYKDIYWVKILDKSPWIFNKVRKYWMCG